MTRRQCSCTTFGIDRQGLKRGQHMPGCPLHTDEKPIRLEASDWQEIYYALLDKANGIMLGKYGAKNEDGVNDKAWIAQLQRVARKIGPDGKHAIKRGVVKL